jgi:tricarballylate dehydrogenase
MQTPVDVLVAGGGNAALCAAIEAAAQGCRVCVVEAAPQFYRGGNTRHTRNCRVAHGAATETLSGPYTEDEFYADLMRVTGGETNEVLAHCAIARSAELLEWLPAHGVRFQTMGGTLSLDRTNAFFLGGGRAMLNALYAFASRQGVRVLYEHEVVDLEIRDGRFVSARVRSPEGELAVTASVLVAASGGFESNLEWLSEYWGDAVDNFVIRGTPHNRGTVLRLLTERGASAVGDPRQCHAIAVDARAPRFDGGIVTRLDCIPFGIVVNRDARRFYDEGELFWPQRYAIWGRLVAGQPEQTAYAIFDAQSVLRFMPSLYPPIVAATIGELAGALSLDPAQLETTVRDFNAAVRDGTFDARALDDCRTEGLTPPKSHWATRLDQPPFYAYPLRPGITFTYYGLRVDDHARVQMAEGGAAENIFAAGEIMAGNILTRGYLAGIGMTIGSVFGRLAGNEAGRNVRAARH